jgi:chemotaxis protein CheZ
MHEPAGFPLRLGKLASFYPENDPERVSQMVRSTLGTSRAEMTPGEAALLAEIEDLAATVAGARAEIAAVGADDITASHISSANDELDAIVTHTAAATDGILEACEQLEAMMSRLTGEDARTLQDCVTRIYEACSFQDITGQRITKVVGALQAIERKVKHMIVVFAPQTPVSEMVMSKDVPAELLNGPQLPASAMDQSDIDALLASFD